MFALRESQVDALIPVIKQFIELKEYVDPSKKVEDREFLEDTLNELEEHVKYGR